jgi:plasmid stabilization system protein ParE
LSTFQLTETAFRDIDSILAYLIDEDSVDYAYRLRRDLFESFANLAQTPGLGHARPELTSHPFITPIRLLPARLLSDHLRPAKRSFDDPRRPAQQTRREKNPPRSQAVTP